MIISLFLHRTSAEWILVKNYASPNESLSVTDLEPSTSYQLRITAHTIAGPFKREDEFVTNAVGNGKAIFHFVHFNNNPICK